jgi:hypothetical protein
MVTKSLLVIEEITFTNHSLIILTIVQLKRFKNTQKLVIESIQENVYEQIRYFLNRLNRKNVSSSFILDPNC